MSDREERFRHLFSECYQPLHAYARRRAAPSDIDDLVAEVLTVAWRRLDDLPAGAELPWLYGVARRVLANQRRGDGRRLRLVDSLSREPRTSDDPTSEKATSGDEPVLQALRRLSARDREVLSLAAWEGLTPAEIAVVLDCTANAAALRLSRARQKLRAELTEIDPTRTSTGRKDTDA